MISRYGTIWYWSNMDIVYRPWREKLTSDFYVCGALFT